MADLRIRGRKIDQVTVCDALNQRGEAIGPGFIIDLQEGLPLAPHLDSHLKLLGEYATRRKIIFACEHLRNRAALGSEVLAEIIQTGADLFATTAAGAQVYRSIEDIPSIAECGSADVECLRPELQRGGVTGITSEPGDGKSTMVSHWVHDIYLTKGVPALFLDRENPISVIADRCARLGITDGPGIKFWGGWLPSEAPMPDSPIVRHWVKEHAGIVVIDSLSAFVEGDQNDATVVRAFMNQCRRLADLGGTLIVLHHTGKSETSRDYRGSSDFKASIDCGYNLQNFGEGGRLDRLVLRPFKSRMGNGDTIIYRYDGGKFTREDRAESAEPRQSISEQLAVILRLNADMNSSRFEDLAASRGIARAKTRAFLADGLKAGFVSVKIGEKNSKAYSLAESKVNHGS